MKKDDFNSINRRDFLKVGVMGATAAALTASRIPSAIASTTPSFQPVYRTLGRTGLKVSVVSFGAMLTPEPEVIRAGLDLGINYIDTARVYLKGKSEEVVAQAIKGRRNKIYLATKTRPTSDSKKEILRDVEESLTELRTDTIDVIQLHSLKSKERAFISEVREALVQLKQQGKVRFFGVTTHTNQAEVVNALVDDPTKFFDTVLVAHNFKSPPELTQAIARAAKANIGVVAMKTQAGGYKTDALGGISPHQAALKWALQDTNVANAIPGMRDMAELREDISVMGMKLTRGDERILEKYARAIEDRYCQLCGDCEGTCPERVSISVINRSLMYAEAYGAPDLAASTYREIPSGKNLKACLDCAGCVARCSKGLEVGQKIARARQIFASYV
jgi:uncharacterized protein